MRVWRTSLRRTKSAIISSDGSFIITAIFVCQNISIFMVTFQFLCYRYVTHKCFPNAVPNTIDCNELFMMHVGLAPSQFIANQSRELASLLWDSSGEIYQSMNLLWFWKQYTDNILMSESLNTLYEWATSRKILSSGFPTKWDSNQPAQLQRLPRVLKFWI